MDVAGQWMVLSVSSAHFIDLDEQTITRIPGKDAHGMNSLKRRPCSIEASGCPQTVGTYAG
jgi:hypothetical protein